MSLLLPSKPQVAIALAPDTVAVVRLKPGWRRRIADSMVQPIAPSNGGSTSCHAAIRFLQELVLKPEWQRGTFHIVLSNHLVHYAMIANDAKLHREDERKAYAEIVFQNIYGGLAADWELCVSPTEAAVPTLACAVSRALLTELRGTFSGPTRLATIQPAMMGAFNSIRMQLGDGVNAIVQIETNRVTLALVAKRRWVNISSRSLTDMSSDAIRQWLDEQCILNNLSPQGDLWLHANELQSAPAISPSWNIHRIRPCATPADPRCWLAASASV